jgi:ribosome-associated translation inhibitor RaiA
VPDSEVTESEVRCNHSAEEGLASKLNSNAKRGKMQTAPQITFEGSESSDAARAQIMSEIGRLENHNQRITGCRVKVIAPSHKHRHGIGFQVHICLTVPPRENVVVTHTGTDDARNEHAQVAINDAFAAARRQVDALAA